MIKWLVVKERESQLWYLVGPTGKYESEEYTPGRKRPKKVWKYKSYMIPKPEHVSPFIECHKIIEAPTQGEALCQILSLK